MKAAKAAKASGASFDTLLEEAIKDQLKQVAIAEIEHLNNEYAAEKGDEAFDGYDDDEESGEEVDMPPTTIANISPQQAARKLRVIARNLAKPTALQLPSMERLEIAINQRTSKQTRLEILERLKVEQANLFDQNRVYIEEIQRLAQHLPTQENLPNGKAENVLRSIQVVLRNFEKNGEIS